MNGNINHARVALLIDADNVSSDVVEQALTRVIAEYGAIHVRRAYCTAEVAVRQRKLFKTHSIRPMVNLAAGKNSTDIALAVDAIDLVVAERPDVVVIVSSDSDFSPLVLRLREKGCRVCGIGQQAKTGAETPEAYDEFIDLAHRKARAAAVKPVAKTPAKRAARAVEAAPAMVIAAAPVWPDEVQRMLEALPALKHGDKLELNVAAERLRGVGLLAKRGSSTKLFKKHPEFFTLLPDKQPNKVQFREPATLRVVAGSG